MKVDKIYVRKLLLESQIAKDCEYALKQENEDTWSITAYYENLEIADVSFMEQTNMYWYFEDSFTEDQYNEMFPDDRFIMIGWLEVTNKKYMGTGVAKELLIRALKKSKQLRYDTIYLNASPIGHDGLQVADLVGFYKNFGFKEILNQGNNVQMLLRF